MIEICDRCITPAILRAGWDQHTQIRREFSFTDGQVLVRGKLAVRGKRKRADYLPFHSANFPLAVVEAKDNNAPLGGGMQQALGYAEALDVPFVFSSNGDGFLFHDRTGQSSEPEQRLTLQRCSHCGADPVFTDQIRRNEALIADAKRDHTAR